MRKNFTYVPTPVEFPELQVTEIAGKRHYITPQGKYYPSVTTALKHLSEKDIERWRTRVGEVEAARISAHASGRGNDIHEMCEHYLRNKHSLTEDSKYAKHAVIFDRLKPHLHKIDNIRGIELPMYSDKLCVAGRADCIAEYEGELSIIDFKTSTKLKKRQWIHGYFMQEAAYSAMYYSASREKAKQLVTIIAVENDQSVQVFVEQTKDWFYPMCDAIQTYHDMMDAL